jgi:hypothetical protein
MTEFKRDFFKHDPVMYKLYMIIKANHKVAEHTRRTLLKNKHIKDFCEQARHFVMMPGDPPLYIHYDVASWYNSDHGAAVKIESIGVYDDFMEYERARLKGIHSTKGSDIPNIN